MNYILIVKECIFKLCCDTIVTDSKQITTGAFVSGWLFFREMNLKKKLWFVSNNLCIKESVDAKYIYIYLQSSFW